MPQKNSPLDHGDLAFRRKALKGSCVEASYSGAFSFMRRKYSRDLKGVDVAVTGIPFDQATTNRPGARFGPEAIRKASAQHAWGPVWPWNFDPFEILSVVDYGDCFFDWGDKESLPHAIMTHLDSLLDCRVFPLVFGGDHYVTYPILKSIAKKHGPVALLHFDAHRDMEEDAFPAKNKRIDHGTMLRLALEEGIILPEKSVQIGIRTCYPSEYGKEMRVLDANAVHQTSPQEISRLITEHIGKTPCYLTFDIDCLDPAFAPGTGTPVPGGLSSFQALSILRGFSQSSIDFVGMDIVEVSPPYDTGEITANFAALFALEFLCLKALQCAG